MAVTPHPTFPSCADLGGFRWEYDNAIDILNADHWLILKPLYESVRNEIVPTRFEVDHSGHDLPEALPRSDDDFRDIEEQIEVWTQTDVAIDELSIDDEDLEELHDFADDMILRLEAHELRQRPLRWLGVPGLDGVLGRDDLQLLLTSFSSGERLWERATVQDDEPPAGITSAVYLANLSERALSDSARSADIVGGPLDPLDDFEIPREPVPWVTLPPEFLAAAPLLYQLIDSTLAQSDNVPSSARRSPGSLPWTRWSSTGCSARRSGSGVTGSTPGTRAWPPSDWRR